jgi:hypothetical protein
MATKEDFTEEEWETLQKGVTGAGFWMTIADRGFFDTFKESSALAKRHEWHGLRLALLSGGDRR